VEGRSGCRVLAASDLVVLPLNLGDDLANLGVRHLQLLQRHAQLGLVKVLERAAVVQPRRGVGAWGSAMILVSSRATCTTSTHRYYFLCHATATCQPYVPWPYYYSPGPLMILAHECGLQSWRFPSRPYW
jgi:hypothetical protein